MAAHPRSLETTSVEKETLEIVGQLLRELGSHRAAGNVSLCSSLERDLGLGSMERVELLMRCETRFNVRLPDGIAQQAETPGDWVKAILRGGETPTPQERYRIEQPQREAPPAPDSATDWVEVLRRQTELETDRVHIHLLEGESGQDIAYGMLLERALAVARGLVAGGLRRDETVAIMLPTCADFFPAFFGVMLAGGIAVPVYPPARPDKIEEYVHRQVSILRNAEVRFLIGFDEVKAVSRIMQLNLPSLVEVTTVGTLSQAGAGLRSRLPEPSDIAFIQYTSGSTGDPKGVMLTQANVLANVRGIGWAVKFRPTDIVVSWLPLYHDMGLIGSWLFSVYFGAPITILSPLAFLSRPERWLWAMHDSRGTLCPAPNFSYELCARRIPDESLRGLDLSCWRVAINAGEAVLSETLERFAQRFEPYGFRPESFVPCYGLAESSVALTFPPIDRRPVIDTIRRDPFEKEGRAVPAGSGESNVLRFVANGKPLPGHEVRVVDDEGRELGARLQGRLLFRGPSTTSGYYRNTQATAAILTEDGWMDSGDLAYWANGELYITGRSKDCIIKSGRNIIPQEVELATAEVPGVRRGCVAAFGSLDRETGTERLVVVAETRATAPGEVERIEAEIVRGVDAVLGTPPDHVLLVPPQTIPKTSSGKIRRNETRALYERGELRTGKRPPWIQIGRLWVDSLDSWFGLLCRGCAIGFDKACTSAWVAIVASLTGIIARLTPGRKATAKVIQWGARCILRSTGQAVAVEGHDRLSSVKPSVLFANRVSQLDPLVLAASIPAPFVIADSSALASVPRGAAFLLRPLVIPQINREARPPGGTLRQRIRRALQQGHSVLVFPEGPTGTPAHLSRFRLDALHAAMANASPVHPIGVRGTTRILKPNIEPEMRNATRVVIGEPVHPETTDHGELAELRARVRRALSKLCQ